MAKCKQCGKSVKGLKKHMQRMHGTGGAVPSDEIYTDSSDGEMYTGQRAGPLTGEIGRILKIAGDGEPVRAKHMMDLYIKGPNPDNSEQVFLAGAKIRTILGVQPIQPRRNY